MYLFYISLKNSFVYRYSMFFSCLGSILVIYINILLWKSLYKENTEMIQYMIRYTIMSNIIAMIYTPGISDSIGGKVSTGAFVIDLLRPINIFAMSWQTELAKTVSKFIVQGLPVAIIFIPMLYHGVYSNILLVLLALILGHILLVLIYALIGFLAFAIIEIWPLKLLIEDTIRLFAGSFLPIAILPGFLKSIATVLPFRFLYSFPLELLFAKVQGQSILTNYLVLLAWICVFIVLNFIVYRMALRKAVVQGG